MKRGVASDEEKARGCLGLIFFILRMTITVALAFALLSTVSYFLIRRFVVVHERPVPNVVGLTPARALEELSGQKFSTTFEKHEYSRVLEEGRIVSQYPSGGTRAKIGSPVRLILSKGSPLVTIPDVRGDTEVGAGIKIRAADMALGKVAKKYSARVKKNAVMAQDPPPRTGAPHQYPVNILVSMGPPPREYLMPPLGNLTLAEARGLAEQMGIEIRDVKKTDSSLPRNRILGQKPLPGTAIREGAAITVTVSTGMRALE